MNYEIITLFLEQSCHESNVKIISSVFMIFNYSVRHDITYVTLALRRYCAIHKSEMRLWFERLCLANINLDFYWAFELIYLYSRVGPTRLLYIKWHKYLKSLVRWSNTTHGSTLLLIPSSFIAIKISWTLDSNGAISRFLSL